MLCYLFQSLREQTRRAVEAKTEAKIRLDQVESEKKTIERKCDATNEVSILFSSCCIWTCYVT